MNEKVLAQAIAKILHSVDCMAMTGTWYIASPIPKGPGEQDIKGWYRLACTCNREKRITTFFVKLFNAFRDDLDITCLLEADNG